MITYQMHNNEAELDYEIGDEAVCAELMRILAVIGVSIPKPFSQEFILQWEYEDMYDHYGEGNFAKDTWSSKPSNDNALCSSGSNTP